MNGDEYKLVAFRKWHDTLLQPGGEVREVTRIRFFLGTHGPFEYTFDRAVSDADVQAAVDKERRALVAIAGA